MIKTFVMNNRDRKVLIGELRLNGGLALIIFLATSLIVAIVTGAIIAWGNPAPGIIKRASLGIILVFILDVIIFRNTFLIAIDLIIAKKVQVQYDGIHRTIDKSEFINMTELLSKLSNSGNFDKIDFNQSFNVELSKLNKEILYIEQFGHIIYPMVQI